jgi:hypothetical protein
MIEFFKSILPYRPWDLADYFMMFLMALALLLVGALLFVFLSWVFKMIFYEFSYDQLKTYDGEVIDMEYTPPRTTTTFNGKTTTTTTTPEKNVVIFKTELKTSSVDSDKLYQRVRVGESVKVESQSYYIKPRFWDGKWEYDGELLISVTSEKNQKVNFNEARVANYRKY